MQFQLAHLFLAAEPTPLEKLLRLPMQVWLNLGLCVLAVLIVVRLWRALRSFNDYAPYLAAVLASSAIFFYWVYERTEPAFLSPVVESFSHFLPSRSVQQQQIEKVRKLRRDH